VVVVMTDATVRIDSFQDPLHGSKILCQGPFVQGAYPPLLEYMTDLRTPFRRRVLLTSSSCLSETRVMDAVFRVRDTTDWSLALTYILHAPKDVLVVVQDIPIPDAVWAKLNGTITLVHLVTAPLRTVSPYDAIFFAPVTEGDHVLRILQQVYKKTLQAKDLKDIFQELRVAGAGLAWTRTNPSLCWYDPVSETDALGSEPLSKKQLSELFLTLSHQFA
jgi:hypothetical protein